MLYQLPDGRTIEMSIYDYFALSDEELNSLIGYNHGAEINNPRYGSSINKTGRPESETEEDFSEYDIPDIPVEEKLKDQDYFNEDE